MRTIVGIVGIIRICGRFVQRGDLVGLDHRQNYFSRPTTGGRRELNQQLHLQLHRSHHETCVIGSGTLRERATLGTLEKPRGGSRSSHLHVLALLFGLIIVTASIILLFVYGAVVIPSAHAPKCANGSASSPNTLSANYGSVVSNLWNLRSAEGSIKQCYSSSTGVNSSASFSNVMVKGPPSRFIGYPEVGYGDGIDGGSFGSQASSITFPMTVDSFSRLNVLSNTTFSTNSVTAGFIDIGYDLWVKGQVSGMPVGTDYEVMILFYFPFSCASYSSTTYQFIDTIYLNSQPTSETWTVCVAGGGSNARLVQFTLQGSSQVLTGNVSLKPTDFIDFVQNTVKGSSLSGYYIEGMEFGTEFWSNTANQAAFQWSMTNWNLSVEGNVVSIVQSDPPTSRPIEP
jgi:hypothetical protein